MFFERLFLRLFFLERKSENVEKCSSLFFTLRARDECHCHSEHILDFFVAGFGKNCVVLDAKCVCTNVIDRVCREAAEVAGSRNCNVEKFVEEAIHARTAECYLIADRLALTEAERRDRLLCCAGCGLLTGDFLEAVGDEFWLLA